MICGGKLRKKTIKTIQPQRYRYCFREGSVFYGTVRTEEAFMPSQRPGAKASRQRERISSARTE